jgi:dienelactone hydrolase
LCLYQCGRHCVGCVQACKTCNSEGFISIAPDALTPLGGYPGNDDAGRELQSKRDQNEMLEDFIAAYDYLKNHKDCNGKVGVVGFCFGGGSQIRWQ